MLPTRVLYFLGLAVFCISGCSRLERFGSQSELDAAVKMQVASLQNLNDGMSKSLSNLNTQLVLALNRISDLENARRKDAAEPQAANREQTDAIESAVSSCVKLVRESAPAESYNKTYWTEFDAYYTPTSGKVRDNVVINGQRPAKYAFDKCMAAKGFPLG